MIPDTLLLDMARRLLEKTRRDEVEWKPSPLRGGDEPHSTFAFIEAAALVIIDYASPSATPDYYTLSISVGDKPAGSLRLYDNDGPDAMLLRDLHAAAARKAMHGDQDLAKLDELLSGDRVLGRSVPAGAAD